MKPKLLTALMILTFAPSLVFAARPSITSLQQQINQLEVIVKGLDESLAKTQSELAETQLTLEKTQLELTSTREDLSATQAELVVVQSNTVLGLDGLLTLTQDANGYDTALFSGVNVQVVNGTGATYSVNGLGNLVIGYNEDDTLSSNRTGSHNFIVGPGHSYAGMGGVLAGRNNILGADSQSSGILGGEGLVLNGNAEWAAGAVRQEGINLEIDSPGTLAISSISMDIFSSSSMNISTDGVLDIKGSLIQLNGGGKSAVRVGDPVLGEASAGGSVTANIISGSGTVLIGD